MLLLYAHVTHAPGQHSPSAHTRPPAPLPHMHARTISAGKPDTSLETAAIGRVCCVLWHPVWCDSHGGCVVRRDGAPAGVRAAVLGCAGEQWSWGTVVQLDSKPRVTGAN